MARLWLVAIPVVVLGAAAVGCWHAENGQGTESSPSPSPSSSPIDVLRQADNAAPVLRAYYGRRLEPHDSVVLHGAGQSDGTSFAAYTKALGPASPMLSMSYVDLRDDIPGYFTQVRAELGRYPDLIIPQIGLSMNAGDAAKHYEGDVAKGTDDAHLRQLCAGLKALDRPAFLRIGYEFNGSWNGYAPATYVAAFRHTVDVVRGCGLENVAMVWDWSPGAELDAESGGADASDAASRYLPYYPGDNYVDWWGLNIFSAPDMWRNAPKTFLSDAERHHMPVMIGESTPKGHSVSEGKSVVDAWYAPYFGLIRNSAGIKAFCYIDWDWSVYPQWSDWGDARIEKNADVLGFYRKEMSQTVYADSRSRADTLRLLRAN